jgi:putative phosphoribosyl transferase
MSPLFADRVEAGRQLAVHLRHLAGRSDIIVLGLPRGGVPVAFEVARALGAALDVFVVRKLGVPGHEELAMGAVATGGVRVINRDVVGALGISAPALEQVTASEMAELSRREQVYRRGRPLPSFKDATVILIDDGVATGATMLAAIRALRALGPAVIIAAAPVMSDSAERALRAAADSCVSVAVPEPFDGVGAWYGDFSQTSDAEVLALLERAAPARPLPGSAVASAGSA